LQKPLSCKWRSIPGKGISLPIPSPSSLGACLLPLLTRRMTRRHKMLGVLEFSICFATLCVCGAFKASWIAAPPSNPSFTYLQLSSSRQPAAALLRMEHERGTYFLRESSSLIGSFYSFPGCPCNCEPSLRYRNGIRWQQASILGRARVMQSDDAKNNEGKEKATNSDAKTDEKVDQVSAAMIGALRGYKTFISPLLPPACRFLPSCSEYSMQAIRELGPSKGLVLTAWRLFRCNPLHFGDGGRGYDPPKWPPVPYDYHYP